MKIGRTLDHLESADKRVDLGDIGGTATTSNCPVSPRTIAGPLNLLQPIDSAFPNNDEKQINMTNTKSEQEITIISKIDMPSDNREASLESNPILPTINRSISNAIITTVPMSSLTTTTTEDKRTITTKPPLSPAMRIVDYKRTSSTTTTSERLPRRSFELSTFSESSLEELDFCKYEIQSPSFRSTDGSESLAPNACVLKDDYII